MDLRDRADAHDARKGAEDREGDGERLPLPPEALLDVVERAAEDTAVGRDLAVLHREKPFGILRRHAEEGRDLHPEERPGAARADGRRDAHDVARADRRGERGAERAELAHLAVHARIHLLVEHVLERALEVEEVGEAEDTREEEARHEDGGDERHAPHPAVHHLHEVREGHQPVARRLHRLRDGPGLRRLGRRLDHLQRRRRNVRGGLRQRHKPSKDSGPGNSKHLLHRQPFRIRSEKAILPKAPHTSKERFVAALRGLGDEVAALRAATLFTRWRACGLRGRDCGGPRGPGGRRRA